MKRSDAPQSVVLYATTVDSPVGPLTLVASETALCELSWSGSHTSPVDSLAGRAEERPDHPVLCQTIRELEEYFAGNRREFEVPVEARGTDFQLRAWAALRTIPYAETISYGEQARRLGQPAASRAVGGANGRNPISIIVPCHRVVGADGSLTGFGGGLDVKRWLLEHERMIVGV